MQHNKVVAWLAQHNFPHGMVAFMDGFSKDPLRQKFNYLKTLQTDVSESVKARNKMLNISPLTVTQAKKGWVGRKKKYFYAPAIRRMVEGH